MAVKRLCAKFLDQDLFEEDVPFMVKDDAILGFVVVGEIRQGIYIQGEQHFVGVLLVKRAVQAEDLDTIFGWMGKLDKAEEFKAVPHQHPILGVLILGTRLRRSSETKFLRADRLGRARNAPSCAVSHVDSTKASCICSQNPHRKVGRACWHPRRSLGYTVIRLPGRRCKGTRIAP